MSQVSAKLEGLDKIMAALYHPRQHGMDRGLAPGHHGMTTRVSRSRRRWPWR